MRLAAFALAITLLAAPVSAAAPAIVEGQDFAQVESAVMAAHRAGTLKELGPTLEGRRVVSEGVVYGGLPGPRVLNKNWSIDVYYERPEWGQRHFPVSLTTAAARKLKVGQKVRFSVLITEARSSGFRFVDPRLEP